ncbi:MAG TPA: hypothetical protein VEJ41_00225 [Candidatus Acidoferrales bacterium]|nr:hypothetical protein [Candidatus Acidoferrales bacterium]
MDTPLVSFSCLFEPLQTVIPELLQERTQVRKPFRARPVQTPGSLSALVHEARFL